MDSSMTMKLRIGAWKVDPDLGTMVRDSDIVRLEPRTTRLLLCLAEHANQVVTTEQLLAEVWPGVVVSPDSIYQAIASLRKLLGDDPKQPTYIATVPRKGYRLVAEVGAWDAAAPAPAETEPAAHAPRRLILLAGACLALVIGIAFWMGHRQAGGASALAAAESASAQKSIAVLPFLDLTEEMKEEYFADGITEELIGRFSKLQGFKVPSPTSSFYYKGKQITVEEFAKRLGVKYVLDGSVRKSGHTVRIAARLMKAENGFVIWSATYDRPVNDLLAVQDDIGEQVTKALNTAIDSR
jgi:TolB-like protein/DNA-binding winged helix-turn-helix (wHTH) protein